MHLLADRPHRLPIGVLTSGAAQFRLRRAGRDSWEWCDIAVEPDTGTVYVSLPALSAGEHKFDFRLEDADGIPRYVDSGPLTAWPDLNEGRSAPLPALHDDWQLSRTGLSEPGCHLDGGDPYQKAHDSLVKE